MEKSDNNLQKVKSGSVSIVTAAFNASQHLPALIESLRAQTEKNFEWIVADGGSTDDTLEMLGAINDLNIKITSQTDFGIYDALNRAIRLASGDYYLVVGADDVLFSDAVEEYSKIASCSQPDIVTAPIMVDGKVLRKKKFPLWLGGAFALVSCHSVGCLFKRGLHDKHGYYSNKYPIAADKLFIKQVYAGGGVIQDAEFVAGIYGTSGASSADVLGNLTESFRIQLETEKISFLQFLIFIIRIVRNYKKF